MNTTGCAPKRIGQVVTVISEQDKMIGVLVDAVSVLASTFAHVCREDPLKDPLSKPEDDKARACYSCEIARAIDANNGQIEAVTCRLQDMIERCEL